MVGWRVVIILRTNAKKCRFCCKQLNTFELRCLIHRLNQWRTEFRLFITDPCYLVTGSHLPASSLIPCRIAECVLSSGNESFLFASFNPLQ